MAMSAAKKHPARSPGQTAASASGGFVRHMPACATQWRIRRQAACAVRQTRVSF